LRILVLGIAVIFVGGEIADALIAKMPHQAELIKACMATVVGALVIVIAMPLIRRPGGKMSETDDNPRKD